MSRKEELKKLIVRSGLPATLKAFLLLKLNILDEEKVAQLIADLSENN